MGVGVDTEERMLLRELSFFVTLTGENVVFLVHTIPESFLEVHESRASFETDGIPRCDRFVGII